MLMLSSGTSRRRVFALPRLYVWGSSEPADSNSKKERQKVVGDDDGTGRDGDTKSCSSETHCIEGYLESEFTVALDAAVNVDRTFRDENFIAQCGELPDELHLKERDDDEDEDEDGKNDADDDDDDDRNDNESVQLGRIEEGEEYETSTVSSRPSLYDDGKQLKPTVWFAMDLDTGRPLCTMYSDYLPLHKSEHRKVWYKQRDYERFRRENKKTTNAARQTSYVADFARVYHSTISSKRLRSLTKKQTVVVADSPNRGFEAAIFLDTLVTDRRACVQQLVEMQEHFLSLGDYLTDEEREHKLAVSSRNLTKQSRRLAFVLGSGDALVAQMNITPAEEKFLMKWTTLYGGNDDEQSMHSIHMCTV